MRFLNLRKRYEQGKISFFANEFARSSREFERAGILTCCLSSMPLCPSLSGFILKRYASRPPTLSIVLNAPAVTLRRSLRPSASLQSALECTLGSHVRRVLLLNVSPTLFPDWIDRPSYKPVWSRFGLSAERDVFLNTAAVALNMVVDAVGGSEREKKEAREGTGREGQRATAGRRGSDVSRDSVVGRWTFGRTSVEYEVDGREAVVNFLSA